jgi:dTDP-4-dehydrorhamnose reductase
MAGILLLGGSGILGSEVLKQLQLDNYEYVAPRSSDLDIGNADSLLTFVKDFKPNWIINCAAWTNVDGAEDAFNEACQLNEAAVSNIATAANQFGSKVIHISTDYVFGGESSEPYLETSDVNPINKYGESKLKGERALLTAISSAYVVRTSWLYGVNGKNFVKTIAGKALRSEVASVVNDQVGSPTSAKDLANGILSIVKLSPQGGIYNYSNEGSCTWFEFAQAIYKAVGADPELVKQISSASLNMIAKRPKFSLLSKEKWKSAGLSEVPEWQASLELVLPEIISSPK